MAIHSKVNARWLVMLAAAALIFTTLGCMARLAGTGSFVPTRSSDELSDPPSRVARLSYIEGSVSFQAAGTQEWSPAVMNRPLTAGDQLWTDNGARAELHLGYAAIRLAARANFGFLDLQDRAVQAKLTEGSAGIRLRRLDEGDRFELDTPNASITLSREGDYRLELHPEDNCTEIIVREGEAEVTGSTQAFRVLAGQQARVIGTDSTAYEISSAPPSDAFDKFCQARDRREERAESARYVSPDVIGYYDLDEFGIWLTHPVWGPYWTPRHVADGWAPYRFGHWVWIEPWGWSWVDDAPWGFAPFHYGRWIFLDSGWSWIPGPLHVRPVYAPALVVFVGGGGPGFRFFYWIGSAGVAWFPLGPREAYVPPYHCSRRYVTNINVTNTIIENPTGLDRIDVARQIYINRTAPGAVTAVPRETFVGGRAVARAAVAVSPREAAATQVSGAAAPVAPTRQSLSRASEPGTSAPRPPDASARRPVIMRRAAPPAPVPFERRQPLLDARPGRPPDRGALEELRRSQPSPSRPEARPAPARRPGIQSQPPARPPAVPRGEVQREQKFDQRRTRAIQNETRREQQARPSGKPEQPRRRPEE